MSNFQPSLVFDDQRATGWARVEIYGDAERGKALLGTARVTLGALKSYQGVSGHQVQDRETTGGGGFYQRWQTLPDGSRIHVFTNDGHDTMRIYANPKRSPKVEPKVREDDIDWGDYLWIGVRVKDGCTRPWYALDVNVVEPDGSVMRGVVGTIFGTTNGWTDPSVDYDFSGSDDDGYELVTRSGFSSETNITDALQSMYNTYNGGAADPFSPNMILGDHQVQSILLRGGNFDGDTLTINWSFNGLMMQYWDDSATGNTDETQGFGQAYGPYDPMMDEQQNAGSERTFEGMNTVGGGTPTTSRYGWDAVFWLDPNDFKVIAKEPSTKLDKRPLIQAFRKKLRDDDMIAKPKQQVQEGLYHLVVRAYGTPPHLLSTRSNDAIPDFPSFPRSGDCDYRNYMETVGTWPPLEVEVEVRIGRNTITQRASLPDPAEIVITTPSKVFNFDLVCESYDDRSSAVWPFGFFSNYDTCQNDLGPNMGGPSYATPIAIDVKNKTAEVASLPVNRVFGTGTYHAPVGNERRRAVFFIFGQVFPIVDVADWPTKGARALFTAAESVTSGVYGCAEMNEMSEGSMLGMLTGTDKSHVHLYDPVSNTLTDLGAPVTLPADWASNDPPDDSTNFFWYYEKAVPYQNNCYRTYGVLVTSVGGFYEMSQNFAGTPGYTAPDCC